MIGIMRIYFFFTFSLVLTALLPVHAQNRITIFVADSANGSPVIGANVVVSGTNLGGTTGLDGSVIISRIPDGAQTIVASSVGYKPDTVRIVFPFTFAYGVLRIRLAQTNVQLEGVTVTTSRTSYHLYDSPDRVEVKGEDDIGETAIDHPSDISELFLESTGIQVLQTSAISNYVSIKLQGLDGSYTQILKDGFPLYGGLSSDLSVTQIPPLDLRRVEIIKGPSSSLYGGGAIAGLINLISKKPSEKGELTLLLNGNTSNGMDAGAFYSKRNNNLGVTVLFNGNLNTAYDGDHTGFSDIPESQSFTFNPKVFYDLSNKTKLMLGLSTTYDNLTGGDMTAIRNGATAFHPYLERSKSDRTYLQLEIESSPYDGTSIIFKNSVGYFFLNSSVESERFYGGQWMSYSELTMQMRSGENILTGGLSLTSDSFNEDSTYSGMRRNYKRWTIGVFLQDDWNLTRSFTLETGLRADKPYGYDLQLLPRAAAIYRVNDEFSVRGSFGLGYEVPTIFSDQSHPDAIYSIMPVGNNVGVEKSVGGEFDINYNTILLNAASVNVDQAFFYTRVSSPLILVPLNSPTNSVQSRYALENANGYLFSRGAETDIKIAYGDLEAFIGYTYTDARKNFIDSRGKLYLTPPSKFVADMIYDAEGFGKAGVEIRYTGAQLLHDGTEAPSFWVSDLLLEKKFAHFMFFLAVENLFNFKQIRYTPIYTGTVTDPHFNDVWAPIEGRVMNAGLRIQM
jgi:outer membrane receptor for ferrienterochelin and colicins